MKFLRYIALIAFWFPGISGLSQITFIADTLIGCDNLEVTFTFINADIIDTVTTVDWDFGNGSIATGTGQQTVTYTSPGSYTVGIIINNNTPISRPEYIRVYPTPDAAFFWSDSLEIGSYAVVLANVPQAIDTLAYTYHWSLEDGGTGDTRAILHRFPAEGEYRAILAVSNEVGCADTSARLVSVTDVLDCPNVFTPNDDGINDYFVISSNGVTIYNLQVYSRTGIMVYKAEAPLVIWDGRNLSGQQLSPGTYYYIIKPVNGSGQDPRTGFVELYR